MSLLLAAVAMSTQWLDPTDVRRDVNASRIHSALVDYARVFPYAQSRSGNHFAGLFGFLPCSANARSARDGSEHCGSSDRWDIGRIPWHALGIPRAFNDQGECYWYLVAGPARKNTRYVNTLYNPDFPAAVHYHGQRGVAAILSPQTIRAAAGSRSRQSLCRDDFTTDHFISALHIPARASEPVVLDPLTIPVRIISLDQVFGNIYQRPDFQQLRDELGHALAECFRQHALTQASSTTNGFPAAVMQSSTRSLHLVSSYRATQLQNGRLPLLTTDGKRIADDCHAIPVGAMVLNLKRGSSWARESAHRRLWSHWKDHWFYLLRNQCGKGGACLEVGGKQVMAALVFAGEKRATQNRPGNQLRDYLEGRWLAHAGGTGSDTLTPSNDDGYCITLGGVIQRC